MVCWLVADVAPHRVDCLLRLADRDALFGAGEQVLGGEEGAIRRQASDDWLELDAGREVGAAHELQAHLAVLEGALARKTVPTLSGGRQPRHDVHAAFEERAAVGRSRELARPVGGLDGDICAGQRGDDTRRGVGADVCARAGDAGRCHQQRGRRAATAREFAAQVLRARRLGELGEAQIVRVGSLVPPSPAEVGDNVLAGVIKGVEEQAVVA
mmetsp:Transcript_45614/g.148251  ORF Transcript_45614/g.148251 Transcript_45614/m.148251 type:complete len:213 (+) Transcript_45614:640-1278(+)